MCSNCLKYELECEYPPEKPSNQSRDSSPKQFQFKRLVSNDSKPGYSSPYTAPTPPKCQCQQLRDAGILPPGGCCAALGNASSSDFKARNLIDGQLLESGALQSTRTESDRLLELKLMHRKNNLALILVCSMSQLRSPMLPKSGPKGNSPFASKKCSE
jgi:hypothetical protein